MPHLQSGGGVNSILLILWYTYYHPQLEIHNSSWCRPLLNTEELVDTSSSLLSPPPSDLLTLVSMVTTEYYYNDPNGCPTHRHVNLCWTLKNWLRHPRRYFPHHRATLWPSSPRRRQNARAACQAHVSCQGGSREGRCSPRAAPGASPRNARSGYRTFPPVCSMETKIHCRRLNNLPY